jgi:hypothetical protein
MYQCNTKLVPSLQTEPTTELFYIVDMDLELWIWNLEKKTRFFILCLPACDGHGQGGL